MIFVKIVSYSVDYLKRTVDMFPHTSQVDYYTEHIQKNENWIFVNVYTDEGISATNTKKRDGFNRMIADALAGKIDLIITKKTRLRYCQGTRRFSIR